MNTPIFQELQAFLQNQLNKTRPDINIEAKTPLLDSGYFDSLELYNLVVFIEERYGLEISEDDITLKNFENLSTIEAFIKRLQSG